MTQQRQGVKLEGEVIVLVDAIVGGGLNLRVGQVVRASKLDDYLQALLECEAVEVVGQAKHPNAFMA